jgi:phosphoenolpyruvate-protein kinase (PTS system EI component)
MHRGIQIGEDRLRTLQLDSMISNMELGVTGVAFTYTEEPEHDRIRVLIATNVESAEFVWKKYAEEGDSAFRRALDEVISDRVADVSHIIKIGLQEYKTLAAKKGMVW